MQTDRLLNYTATDCFIAETNVKAWWDVMFMFYLVTLSVAKIV
jgi:hypothetical protein